MKNSSVYPAIVILALALSTPLLAADKEKDNGTAAAVTTHAAASGGGAGASTAVERPSTVGSAAAVRSGGGEPRFSRVSTSPATNSSNTRLAQTRANNAAVAARFANEKFPKPGAGFNRDNHYGGRWSEAKEHPDWSHNGIHIWNHHHYRWFDGGWMILDDDFGAGSDAYEDEPVDTGPVSFNSIARRVQAELAKEGYYAGAMDGSISPEFRKAIEKYQGAHGLHVTGLIDAPVIESLQVD